MVRIKVDMIFTRKEFADVFNNIKDGLGKANSGLWIPEQSGKYRCEWFICVKPVTGWRNSTEYDEYWDWCRDNMKGHVRCFSSDTEGQKEWWGFGNKDDIVMWMLRWA